MEKDALRDDFESLRQGFRAVLDFLPLSPAQRMSFEAYHQCANRRAVELGGEDVHVPEHTRSPEFQLQTDLAHVRVIMQRILDRTNLDQTGKSTYMYSIDRLVTLTKGTEGR